MIENQIYSKIFLLNSKDLKQDLVKYLDFLLSQQFVQEKKEVKRVPKFGCAKGKFRMSEDFNDSI
ncbi:MAG: DUF2281 domain-containing protein [Chitinophagales bacterium]